jgi:hypothetical protein
LCSFWVSLCVHHHQLMCNLSCVPLKHLCMTQDLVPEGLLNHCEGLHSTFPKTGTKFDAHSLFLSLINCENVHRSCT